ncbi:hypothetical protein SPOG_05779 [Schizosaccharomyces cryophilus OY26]|uniref:Uncharacterized protein n=1 Tax=Schizosaccharomyces cryophilus (strain OY26 / ATCC MYA-4695 / CBS 11777 / NBRC 106824 / NRRL Y48691) TaxID=653667 RepID=S9VMI0_SCHCR|nr:uncharacterized protein SPOG_05779 [Schizosaccharomyces cryophilus OY26]EPY49163.1 hypothetical protein SPOG_05779 [Schizosaccharomyces cryophilus OY26]
MIFNFFYKVLFEGVKSSNPTFAPIYCLWVFYYHLILSITLTTSKHKVFR